MSSKAVWPLNWGSPELSLPPRAGALRVRLTLSWDWGVRACMPRSLPFGAGVHGRPVRLGGFFSMDARLIFHCLLELARCGPAWPPAGNSISVQIEDVHLTTSVS